MTDTPDIVRAALAVAAENAALRAEVERLRKVADAAVAWRAAERGWLGVEMMGATEELVDAEVALGEAVDAFTNGGSHA